ncbi:MAG: helix-turn-helix domain-containing protein [Alphaproteobacteria bacterium]|nr:helix-turn-helix domain-containing protein [Alphaproteobacteria bacterium]
MKNDALIKAIDLLGGQSKLARRVGVKQAHVWYWLNKAKVVPAEAAILIERATDGKVTLRDLRPDLFPKEAA